MLFCQKVLQMPKDNFHTPAPATAFAVVAQVNPVIRMALLFSDARIAASAAVEKSKDTGLPHHVVDVTISCGSFW
jgi:hypothetical protein